MRAASKGRSLVGSLLVIGGLVAAGCASSAGVTAGRSNQSETTLDTTLDTTLGTTAATTPGTTPGTTAPSPTAATVTWAPCPTQHAPWQCGTISAPLDYTNPTGKQINIALNRLPALQPAQRIGSLVVNPGGPGGSGVNLAANEADSMPAQIRNVFDIVGFDPRGVGRSSPITCAGDTSPGSASLRRCIGSTGNYLSQLDTPNAARDLDRVREAIGDSKLTYLGFSYGTALGGVYADMFPTHVRALVLDGSVDPAAGQVNTTKNFADDFYVQQDFTLTLQIFLNLCDATTACLAGPHSATLLNSVEAKVASLPTKNFGGGRPLTADDVGAIIRESMYTISFWPMLAVALADAENGDASTLAALASYQSVGYPATMESEPNFAYANLAIRCADFAGRGLASRSCHDFPPAVEPMPEITTAVGAPPIVVVGTKGDPATPWRFSAKMATALGNAVSITWEGAGHTAFLTSKCVTDLVTAYIVGLTVPADGADCPFVVGVSTFAGDADKVFKDVGTASQMSRLDGTLMAEGDSQALAECIGKGLIANADERLLIHELLGVETADLVSLRSAIKQKCITGG